MQQEKQFDFGQNWTEFSVNLKPEQFEQAIESLDKLIGAENIRNQSFIDIGCGSGLFSIAAAKLGASFITGIDINTKCIETSEKNAGFFKIPNINFIKLSILSPEYTNIRPADIVYAWGSLHHTGKMWEAISNTSQLVNPNGLLVLAIYNRNFTSTIWYLIKYLYNLDFKILQKFILWLYLLIIVPVKFILYPKSFLKRERGMSNYHDAVDWLGGFPYQYASKNEIVEFLSQKNFELVNYFPTKGFTGCNEFVFKRKD